MNKLVLCIVYLAAVAEFGWLSINQSYADDESSNTINAQEILDIHNQYRDAVGVPNLEWSDALASDAQQWAEHLASIGEMKHSDNSSRSDQGENLWAGSPGADWTSSGFAHMVNSWGEEGNYFAEGIFPNVSTTGNWQDVGHYTQIIWRNTNQVGCGGSDSNSGYFFVCRYSPSGNYQGEPVF